MGGIQMTDVVRNLLIINIIFFIASAVMPDLVPYLSVYYPASPEFKPFQLLTYMFMHGSVAHIFFNMIGLVTFGSSLEMFMGPKRFFSYYLVCGLGALVVDFAWQYYRLQSGSVAEETLFYTPMLGASGAVMGLVAGFAIFFPEQRLQLLFPPITLTARQFALIYAALEIFLGVGDYQQGVAHFAHIGGMFSGLVYVAIWRKTR